MSDPMVTLASATIITRLIPNLLTIPAAGNARMMLTTVNDVMSHPKVLTSRPNACMSTGAIGGTLNMLMGTEQLARNTTMSITHAYGGVLAISCPVPFFASVTACVIVVSSS